MSSYPAPDRPPGPGELPVARLSFNDRRRTHLPTPPLDTLPTESELAAARERATIRWEPPLDTYDHTAYFYVNDVPDALNYLLCADTHRLSPDDMESLVRHVEDVFIAAALDPHGNWLTRLI